jgi:hypothetical protein
MLLPLLLLLLLLLLLMLRFRQRHPPTRSLLHHLRVAAQVTRILQRKHQLQRHRPLLRPIIVHEQKLRVHRARAEQKDVCKPIKTTRLLT